MIWFRIDNRLVHGQVIEAWLPHIRAKTLVVANDDLALRPGMTATSRILTIQRDDVLLVPNAALRFVPPTTADSKPSGSFVSRLMPRPPQPKKQTPKAVASDAKQVCVLHDGRPTPIPVQTGASNGRQTEITGGELKAGMDVIVDYQASTR